MNIKYRTKFNKLGKMKFIGHLDLVTIFQRSIKRACIPVRFSSGYNPHQLTSFALPLPIGMESLGEYMDIVLESDEETTITKGMEALEKELPDGLSILGWQLLPQDAKSAASLVDGADYEIIFPKNDLAPQWDDLLQNAVEIKVQKKTKSGLIETDIKPDIHEVVIEDNIMKTRLSAGGKRMLKPQLLLSYLYESSSMPYDPNAIRYTRLDLLHRTNGNFVSLGAFGKGGDT